MPKRLPQPEPDWIEVKPCYKKGTKNDSSSYTYLNINWTLQAVVHDLFYGNQEIMRQFLEWSPNAPVLPSMYSNHVRIGRIYLRARTRQEAGYIRLVDIYLSSNWTQKRRYVKVKKAFGDSTLYIDRAEFHAKFDYMIEQEAIAIEDLNRHEQEQKEVSIQVDMAQIKRKALVASLGAGEYGEPFEIRSYVPDTYELSIDGLSEDMVRDIYSVVQASKLNLE